MRTNPNMTQISGWQFVETDLMRGHQEANVGLLQKEHGSQREAGAVRLNGIFFYCKLLGGMINESLCRSQKKELAEKREFSCKGCSAI